jgi:2-polyprenyl-6-methoxyphenol hydroxylase-like FAD-dependent oxidoreductase
MALVRAAPRVCVVGAGISGLALAAILSRQLPGARLTVLERASSDRDEGYGLDLDEWGQEALVRAGVFDRLWSVTRDRSSVFNVYPLRGDKPLMSRWTRVQHGESNRAGVRSLFIEVLQSHGHHVEYQRAVGGAYAAIISSSSNTATATTTDPGGGGGGDGSGTTSSCAPIVLTAPDGTDIGEFDVAIDAGGLYSPLRHLRVRDDVGVHFAGITLIHGVINDPEASAPAALVDRLGQGTAGAAGRGYSLTVQRFGAAAEDRRAAFFYLGPHRERDGQLQEDMGIARATSRRSGILMLGNPDFDAVKQWLHADMEEGGFDRFWHGAVDALDRITVRGMFDHGVQTELRADDAFATLPLACCGDALRHIGLGGGGNLALQDALHYASVLTKPGAFDDASGRLTCGALQKLRKAEADALDRKRKHFKYMTKPRDEMMRRVPGADPNCQMLGDFADKWYWKVLLNGYGWVAGALRAIEEWRQGGRLVGSDTTGPLYKNVAKALEEEKLVAAAQTMKK